ncbi:cytosolic carboxypeptidase 3 [Cariama cristata]
MHFGCRVVLSKFVPSCSHNCQALNKFGVKQILSLSDSEAAVPRPQEAQNLDDSSPASQFSLVYWPHQCEVIRDRLEHVDWIPSTPEPLYTTTAAKLLTAQTPVILLHAS